MNISLQIQRLLSKMNYTPEQTGSSNYKAILYFLLILAMIISINERVYTPIALTIACLLIGYKDIRVFTDFKRYRLTKLLKISDDLFFVSGTLSIITIKIMGLFNIHDPQGLRDTVYTNEVYLNKLFNLPFTVAGEEFLKLLIFISFFILLSQFSGHTRIFIAVVLAAFIFGHMHIFAYKLTAGIPLMIGAIPTFYFMLYYRSILPLIIEHFFFDFAAFSMHTQYQEAVLACLMGLWIVFCIWGMLKSPSKKENLNT